MEEEKIEVIAEEAIEEINEFAEKGAFSIACAFATILILITYGSVLLMDLVMKYFGTSRKIKEDD